MIYLLINGNLLIFAINNKPFTDHFIDLNHKTIEMPKMCFGQILSGPLIVDLICSTPRFP
jgi:hypothetical protein